MKLESNRGKILVKLGIAFLVVAVIAGYIYHQSSRLIEGPQITILSPSNGSTTASSFTEITGIAKNIAKITLNDRPIYIDEKGNFSEQMLLLNGINILKFDAQDKFGKKTVRTLELVHI